MTPPTEHYEPLDVARALQLLREVRQQFEAEKHKREALEMIFGHAHQREHDLAEAISVIQGLLYSRSTGQEIAFETYMSLAEAIVNKHLNK